MVDIMVLPVRTRHEQNIFLTFPWKIYRDDPLWVPPLLPERKKAIDPKHGVFFQRGSAEFFIAWRDGKPVGTICSAEDSKANSFNPVPDCLFGFFEFINDYRVFTALLERVRQWAKERGLVNLYGPFNLDYEDGYGVLLEGRDRPPVLYCGHTPPYYRDFYEQYGFAPARGCNLAFAFDLQELDSPAIKRLQQAADRLRQKGRFHIRPASLDQWDEEIDRVFYLINIALAHLPGHIPWQREALEALFLPFKDIADPELVLFAEDGDKTVGFFPGVPNLNEVFHKVNGLRYPWDYLKLLYYLKQRPQCLTIKSVLVLPEYWGSGVSLMLFDEMARRAKAKGYRWVDLSLTSDDNPNTPVLAERMGAKIYKKYQVYRITA